MADNASALSATKSPDSALIAGVVAGFASVALLALILFVLWRTRKRPYITAQPERIVPAREESQISTRSDFPIMNLSVETASGEKDGGPGASRASSKSLSRVLDASLDHNLPT